MKYGLQVDVYWFAYAGKDPLEMMTKLSGRMPLLHLKDMAADADRNFCEVGYGVLSMKEIIEFAKDMDVEFAFVEQDANYTVSSMESAKASFDAIYRNM